MTSTRSDPHDNLLFQEALLDYNLLNSAPVLAQRVAAELVRLAIDEHTSEPLRRSLLAAAAI